MHDEQGLVFETPHPMYLHFNTVKVPNRLQLLVVSEQRRDTIAHPPL